MDRLKRARVYLRSGRMVRNALAYMGLTFGVELILLGNVPQLHGIASSLGRLFSIPAAVHGTLLAIVSVALAYASAHRLRGTITVLLIANVSFYSCVATAAVFAARATVFLVCFSAAVVSFWQVIAVMWGGSAHVVGSSHHDSGEHRIGGHRGGDRAVGDARN